MLTIEEALKRVMATARPLPPEEVGLDACHGRVLAEDLYSPLDVPPWDNSAMDGFAVVAEDTFGAGRYEPSVLRCVETVFTGQTPQRGVGRGECAQIATGAPIEPVAPRIGDGL